MYAGDQDRSAAIVTGLKHGANPIDSQERRGV